MYAVYITVEYIKAPRESLHAHNNYTTVHRRCCVPSSGRIFFKCVDVYENEKMAHQQTEKQKKDRWAHNLRAGESVCVTEGYIIHKLFTNGLYIHRRARDTCSCWSREKSRGTNLWLLLDVGCTAIIITSASVAVLRGELSDPLSHLIVS